MPEAAVSGRQVVPEGAVSCRYRFVPEIAVSGRHRMVSEGSVSCRHRVVSEGAVSGRHRVVPDSGAPSPCHAVLLLMPWALHTIGRCWQAQSKNSLATVCVYTGSKMCLNVRGFVYKKELDLHE